MKDKNLKKSLSSILDRNLYGFKHLLDSNNIGIYIETVKKQILKDLKND